MAQKTAAPSIRRFGGGEWRAEAARRDLVTGVRDWILWTSLGWLDVRQRYRRAILGPFWITISMAVMVVALGVLYAGIFRQDVRDFLPYLAAGFIVWNLISGTINEGTSAFVQSEGLIKQGGIPLSVHVFRVLFRNLIVGAHNLTVMLFVYIWQPALLSWEIAFLIPGIALIIANLSWLTMMVGVLCTRFRDLPPIIYNLLQIMFFMSPIMYKPNSLPAEMSFIAKANPVFYLVEVVRAPLLGQLPSVRTYEVLVGLAVVGWVAAYRFFKMTRSRVPYWV